MEFRSMVPAISHDENINMLLGYIENLKAELEVKLTAMETLLSRIKEQLIKEAQT